MTKPMSMRRVSLLPGFWKDYAELVRKEVIPYQWEVLNDRAEGDEKSGCLSNFRIAAGKEQGSFHGYCFQDSDVYKWLEACAFSLMGKPDDALEEKADEAVDLIVSAQQPDGYLDTYYIINGLERRFTDLADSHELYCLGHLTEAAAAYFRATGKRKLLDAAIRFIGCVERSIGPEEGKLHGYPGHEVLEMALMKVYALTGEDRYRRLASYFINERGRSPLYFEAEKEKSGKPFPWKDSHFQYQYYQAGKPVREQDKAEGHAVRMLYLCSGMADAAAADMDSGLLEACSRLWDNITRRQMYITGAVGAQRYGESFTFDYNLPNDSAYGETCASIALVFFAQRMFLLTHEGKYMDEMERALYNSVLSGISLDGHSFFYVNPLEVEREAVDKLWELRDTEYRRQPWFGCACCPPNLARLVSSIGEYAYSEENDVLFINQYMSSETDKVRIETDYPWDGRISLSIKRGGRFVLALRIPGWAGSFSLLINGSPLPAPDVNEGYVRLDRKWTAGETLTLVLDMPIRMIEANPLVSEDIGKVALMRGPLVYCLEEVDNGPGLGRLSLSPDPELKAVHEDILGGVVTIRAKGRRLRLWAEDRLYREAGDARYERTGLKFIPYYAWANRAPGDMSVWIRR